MSQARFQKQQREKARRERAAAKWSRREERRERQASAPAATADRQAELLGELADLHQRYEAGAIQLEEFLDAKDELTQRLDIR